MTLRPRCLALLLAIAAGCREAPAPAPTPAREEAPLQLAPVQEVRTEQLRPASGSQYYPRAASSGLEVLVGWWTTSGSNDTLLARLRSDGVSLDPLGVSLTEPLGSYGNDVAVTFDGQQWAVLVDEWDGNVRLYRLDRTLRLTAPPMTLATGTNDAYPALAWGPTSGLAVWTQYVDPAYTIRGAVLERDGGVRVLDGGLLGPSLADVDVGFDGTNFVVQGAGTLLSDPIRAQRVAPDGTLVGGPLTIAASGRLPTLASTQGWTLSVFLNGSYTELRGVRLDADGGLLDPVGGVVLASGTGLYDPTVTDDDGGVVVAWLQGPDVRALRVAADGTATPPGGAVLAPASWYAPYVVPHGEDYFLFVDADDAVTGETPLWVQRFSRAWVARGPRALVSGARPAHDFPAVALGADGGAWLAWADDADGPGWSSTVKVAPATSAPVAALRLSDPGNVGPLALADLGTGLVVAWREGQALRLSRVSPAGVRLEPRGGVVVQDAGVVLGPALAAFADGGALLAWASPGGTTTSSRDLFAVRLSPSGAIEDATPLLVEPNVLSPHALSATASAEAVVVSWRGGAGDGVGLRGVDRAGRFLADAGYLDVGGFGASLARTADGLRLGWWKESNTLRTVYTLGLDGWGREPPSAPVTTTDVDDLRGVWLLSLNGRAVPVVQRRTATDDLFVVADGGALLPLAASDTHDEWGTAVASDGARRALVAWVAEDRRYNTWIRFRSVSELLPGAPCADPGACSSGFCVDGVCCATPCGGGDADCQACSVQAGGASDGTCTPRRGGSLCRARAGACDVEETCDGTSTACPPDDFKPAQTPCREPDGRCEVAALCTGADPECPPNGPGNAGALCRPSAAACDAPEHCDGVHVECPPDGFVDAGVECRAPAGECDVAEACTGAAADCPADGFAPEGTVCRDPGHACDAKERCTGDTPRCPDDAPAPAGTPCGDAPPACWTPTLTCDETGVCPTDCPPEPPPPWRLGVGCGCSGAPWSLACLALLALRRRARRRG